MLAAIIIILLLLFYYLLLLLSSSLLAQCIRHRTIAMTSVRLPVHLFGMGVHGDHMVHISTDLSLPLDSPMLWAP